MVEKEKIEKIINTITSNITNKCHYSIKEIQSILSTMEDYEKADALEKKLNPAQLEHYHRLLWDLSSTESTIIEQERYMESDEYAEYKELIEKNLNTFKKDKERIKDLIFKYERKIVDGKDYNESEHIAPTVDINNYKQDNQIKYDEEGNIMDGRDMGDIERKLINNQKNVNFSEDGVNSLRAYFGSDSYMLNSRLNKGSNWGNLTPTEKKHKKEKLDNLDKNISDCIKQTKGLEQPTILYHTSEFDVNLNKGDKIVFNGYVSATFQENVALNWHDTYLRGKCFYTYRILTPTATKGVCANDDSHGKLSSHYGEHEYLLDKGLTGEIVDVDVDNHIVTVLAEE